MLSSIFDQLFVIEATDSKPMIQEKVPGKLFLAGEYAVLEAGQPAILIAVDQYLTCQIMPSQSNGYGALASENSNQEPHQYVRTPSGVIVTKENSYWNYALNAIQTTEEVLREGGVDLKDYRIRYITDLVSEDGDKYGLGSSGAVTVSTIKALLSFYNVKVRDNETLFKLAAISLIRAHSKGSLADIAAIVTGGWVYYQSFDRKRLKQKLQLGASTLSLISKKWPLLKIESLPEVSHMQLLVGWTQKPASTDQLVTDLQSQIQKNPEAYQMFLKQSASCVRNMFHAFMSDNLIEIQNNLADYRYLLLNLNDVFGVTIETPDLSNLITIAQSYQYESKSSGAGGGDCGIAIGYDHQPSQMLLDSWKEAGIIPLHIKVAPHT